MLGLKIEDFLERRLQTLVHKRNLAKSTHQARVFIRLGHIRVGKQTVNVPSFMVRTESENHIDFAITSPYGGGRPGRVARRFVMITRQRCFHLFLIFFFFATLAMPRMLPSVVLAKVLRRKSKSSSLCVGSVPFAVCVMCVDRMKNIHAHMSLAFTDVHFPAGLFLM